MYRYGSFGSSGGAVAGLGIAALVLAIVATVLVCIFVMPKKRAGQLSGFLAKLHDIVNFKTLIIEKILKVLYVFTTCFVILGGFLEIFAGAPFFACLLAIVVGPFIVRLM